MSKWIFGAYNKSAWPSINGKQAFSFKPVACTVCGKQCSQYFRCMKCKQWLHLSCSTDGVCEDNCDDMP
jgi:hypothetical protein